MKQEILTIRNAGTGSPFILCPKCKEKLSAEDIEFFYRCPYCDYCFEKTSDVDDFIISAKEWAAFMQSCRRTDTQRQQ